MTRKITRPGYNTADTRRGNTTYGENRKGWKGGRTPAYPADTLTWWLSRTQLSDREYALAVLLGNGNAAQGVRRALNATQLDPENDGAPLDRFGAETWIRKRKAHLKAGLDPTETMGREIDNRDGWDDLLTGGTPPGDSA